MSRKAGGAYYDEEDYDDYDEDYDADYDEYDDTVTANSKVDARVGADVERRIGTLEGLVGNRLDECGGLSCPGPSAPACTPNRHN
jgi:hypothetical protein